MKNMKKLLAALMTAMVLVMVAPAAFAEDVQPEQTASTEQSAPEVQAPAEEAKPEVTAEPEATVAPEVTAEAAVEVQPEATPAPEATVEAQTETTPAPEATQTETTLAPEATQIETTPAPEATQNIERSIKVISDSSSLQVGDTMTLTAKLSGFDGVEYQLNWQVKTEGGDWENLSGEHGETLKVNLDDQSVGAQWRVVVETAD